MFKTRKADMEKTQAPPPPPDFRLSQAETGCDAPQCPMTSEEIVSEFFKYHPPNNSTIQLYAAINQAAKNFAEVVMGTCPYGADRTDAIRKIREARMVANAAIALNGLSLY